MHSGPIHQYTQPLLYALVASPPKKKVDVNKNDIIRNKGVSVIELSQPKGVKPKRRESKLKIGIN
jgi:hypothetical protein